MASDLTNRTIIILICLVFATFKVSAAELYWSVWGIGEHKEQPWQKMPLIDRVEMLTEEGIYLSMEGTLVPGDFDQLIKVHSLVPVHTLRISSPGGSVADALKIAGFVDANFIEVEADSFCDEVGKERPYCGCASSCALIWLAAPIRAGHEIKIHRPYFDASEFRNLPDEVALQRYSEATSQVRSLLQSHGYSPDFIGTIFKIPREETRALTIEELRALPINSALDELISARCYPGRDEKLREYSALMAEIGEVLATEKQLSSKMPSDRIGYELMRDPLYAETYAERDKIRNRERGLRERASKLEKVVHEFWECKRKERIQVSLKKGGQRLTNENRVKLKELRDLIGWWQGRGLGSALIAKTLPDHWMGRQVAEELQDREQRLDAMGDELRRELPAAHREFLAAARSVELGR